ncbi:MAG TPA: hypothetical protein VNF04_07975 [Stellaceae bacterium]|nr:hypothetical protein [Stellaceae bacterium]
MYHQQPQRWIVIDITGIGCFRRRPAVAAPLLVQPPRQGRDAAARPKEGSGDAVVAGKAIPENPNRHFIVYRH